MAVYNHGKNASMTLRGVATTNTAGLSVPVGVPKPVYAVVYTVTFPVSGSTKCAVRPEVQYGMSTRWTQIGAAATTIKSTQAGLSFRTTSATPFNRARLRLVTRTTSASANPDRVSGWISGV